MRKMLELLFGAIVLCALAVGVYLLAKLVVWLIVLGVQTVGYDVVALVLAAWWVIRAIVSLAREGDE